MGGIDTNLATSALAIALVALLVSLAQLLQQYFATADGYRNCQKSVMAQWSVKTKRRFRLREFRIETLFETPEIFLAGPGVEKRAGQVLITGTIEARNKTLTPLEAFDPDRLQQQSSSGEIRTRQRQTALSRPIENSANELVCWLPLLHWLHETSEASLDLAEKMQDQRAEEPGRKLPLVDESQTVPALIFQKRSWDFQPPGVFRPLAKSTVSDIMILARRMGMKWKDLRLENGTMHAEGHSHVLTSTAIGSLGIVLQYSYSGRARSLKRALFSQAHPNSLHQQQGEIYIPSAVADMFGFGLVGDGLIVPRLKVGGQWEIANTLDEIDTSGRSGSELRKRLGVAPGFTFRMGDLVALTSPMAHQLGSSLVQVPSPSENVHGFTTSSKGRQAFRAALQDYMQQHPIVRNDQFGEEKTKPSERPRETKSLLNLRQKPKGYRVKLICEKYDEFKADFEQWERNPESWVVKRDKEYLNAVHCCYDELTEYFEQEERYHYVDLLAHHINHCIFRDSSRPLQGYSAEEEVSHWFREMERIGDDMAIADILSKAEVMEDWIAMMFRACCWGACHFFVPGKRAPAACYGSQLPVYIG